MEIFLKVWILFQLIVRELLQFLILFNKIIIDQPSGWAEISNAEYEEVMQVYKSRFNEVPGPGGRIAGGLPGSQDLFSYQASY